jgi:hypothetical protein
MERENDLVLFRNYGDPLIAQFHKAFLQEHGIPCVLKDLTFNFPTAFFSSDSAGIKILVRNRDLQGAFDLMSEDDDDLDFDTDDDLDLGDDLDLDFDDDDDFDAPEADELIFDEKELEEGFDIEDDFEDDFGSDDLFDSEDLEEGFGFTEEDEEL